MNRLQLDEDKGDAIYKPHKVSSPLIHFPCYPELGCKEEVIVTRIIEVYYLNSFGIFIPLFILYSDLNSFPEHLVYFLIGYGRVLNTSITGEFFYGKSYGFT